MFIFLCEGYSTNRNKYTLGDSLFHLKQYKEASIEYELIAYNASSLSEANEALLRKAECKLAMQLYEEAENTMSRVRFYDISDTLYIDCMYKYALCCYLSGNLSQCETLLMNLTSSIDDTSRISNSYLLYGLCMNEKREYDKAKELTLNYLKYNKNLGVNYKESAKKEIEELYSKKNLPKIKNPAKAERLSTFLPGTGQIYAGYYFEGITNVMLQLVSLGFGGYQIYLRNYITGGIIGMSLAQRFHMGGMSRSAFLCEKHNYLVCKKFNERVKGIFLSDK